MKHRTIFLLVICCFALHVGAQELPLLGRLPELGRDWVLLKQEAKILKQETKQRGDYEYSWASFTNSKTGDLFSFAADRWRNTNRAVGSDPTRESTLDMFAGGLPKWMRDRPSGWMVADAIRFSVITLNTGRDGTLKNVQAEAFEYSFVYESRAPAVPNRLAHGYVLAFGDTCVYVQHTSTRVITSDDARSAAAFLLRHHPSSRPKP